MKILGFVLGVFLFSQYAVAVDDATSDTIEEATEQGSVEQFEQTLEESPTAAGMANMKGDAEKQAAQAGEPVEITEEVDVIEVEPMDEPIE